MSLGEGGQQNMHGRADGLRVPGVAPLAWGSGTPAVRHSSGGTQSVPVAQRGGGPASQQRRLGGTSPCA